jgi:Ala-tRNA(Pro) deacylase
MAVAHTLRQFLEQQGVGYDMLQHPTTMSSMRSAEASHVPGDRLAKAVVLSDQQGYLLAILPASHHLVLDDLAAVLQRQVKLATEQEVESLFPDCVRGAVPPIGAAYGVNAVIDDSIAERPEVFFEAGDHTTLVHVTGAQFNRLTAGAQHGRFSRHN